MKNTRIKKIVPLALVATTLAGGLALSTSSAMAGDPCCEHKKDHVIRVPGFQVQGPNVTVSTASTHMNKGGSSTLTGGSSGFVVQNQQLPRSYFYGGGGGGYIGGGSVPTVINNLTIDGGLQTRTITEQIEVPYTETVNSSRWVEQVYVLQAVCMDDTGTPHPASRPDPNEQIDPNFNGEVFRCMAGTWMQISFGEYTNGAGQFNNGSTMACAKGEALVHRAGGQLSCAAQIPRRNCNERSLLRKYGPGVKVVRVSRQEQFSEQVSRTRMETRTRQVTEQAPATAVSKTLVLSGGVGGG
jgi:hypothetical protein